jgi:hypothetical protein
MLYLHCGWPRTATSSLQRALAANAEELARVGLTYPAEWRHGDRLGEAHHGLADLLTRDGEPGGPIDRFQDDLRSWEGNVLLSSEAISNWVVPWLAPALTRMLDSIREVTRVTTLWTLRRMDDLLVSMYLHQVLLGEQSSPSEWFDHRFETGWIEAFVRGHAAVVSLDEIESVHVKYADDGAHCGELLDAAGVPASLRRRIAREIDGGPRTGERLTRKGVITLTRLDQLSERAGVALDRKRLTRAFYLGEVSFPDDAAFDVIDRQTAARVHETALEVARAHGFAAYVHFFGDDQVEGPSSPSAIDLDLLTDEDLRRVAAAGEVNTAKPRPRLGTRP